MSVKIFLKIKPVRSVLLVISLSACATLGEMDGGLNALLGKDYHEAFDVLGYPTDVQKVSDATIYSWINNSSAVVVTPQTTFNRGDVEDKFYQGTSTTINRHHVQPYRCQVHLTVNADDIIVKHNSNGQISACRDYIHNLNEYLESQK